MERELALKKQVARAEVAALAVQQDNPAVQRAEAAEAELADLSAEVEMLREGMKVRPSILPRYFLVKTRICLDVVCMEDEQHADLCGNRHGPLPLKLCLRYTFAR